MARVKHVIRSRRGSRPKKKNERDCRYYVVDDSGENYVAETHKEAIQLAAQVNGEAYVNCAGRKTRIEE